MDLKEFTEKFKEVFDDEVDLTPETYFKELDEYSSMTVLSIIAFADENFEKEITAKDIREIDTVEDLYNLLTD